MNGSRTRFDCSQGKRPETMVTQPNTKRSCERKKVRHFTLRKSQKNSEWMALLRTGEHLSIVFKIELIYFVFSPEPLRNHGPALINVFTAARSPRADKKQKSRMSQVKRAPLFCLAQ